MCEMQHLDKIELRPVANKLYILPGALEFYQYSLYCTGTSFEGVETGVHVDSGSDDESA